MNISYYINSFICQPTFIRILKTCRTKRVNHAQQEVRNHLDVNNTRNPSMPLGKHMYPRLSVKKVCILPTHFIFSFCRFIPIIFLYTIRRLVFITEEHHILCEVRCEYILKIPIDFSLQSVKDRCFFEHISFYSEFHYTACRTWCL
jgi:hypothetical protein